MVEIATRLKSLRTERGFTQKVVAEGMGIKERHYQFYEHGDKKPGCEKLVAMADFFDVSTDYLLGRTNDPRMYR